MRECNILLDELPTSVEVDKVEYEIDTNFRAGILYELIMTDRTLSPEKKLATILIMYYGDNIPPDKRKAIDAVCEFYRCGIAPKQEMRETTARGAARKKRMDRIYDFDADAPLFYAAFLEQYGIDLNDIDYLHWWKFMAMFEGLNRDLEIMKVMEIRATDTSAISNPKEQQRIIKLQNHYRIDAELTTEDKAEIAGAVFG